MQMIYLSSEAFEKDLAVILISLIRIVEEKDAAEAYRQAAQELYQEELAEFKPCRDDHV